MLFEFRVLDEEFRRIVLHMRAFAFVIWLLVLSLWEIMAFTISC